MNGPVPHGTAFPVKAYATDSLSTTVTSYSGAATWSSLDGALSPETPAPFANGVSTTLATIPAAFARDRVTVVSGGVTGMSAFFSVT